MNQEGNRVQCPNCGAMNFPSSTNCWQCGFRLHSEQDQSSPAERPTAPLGTGPALPPGPYPQRPVAGDTSAYIIIGFILAFFSYPFTCCCPFIFSVPALVLGLIAHSKGDKLGIWVVIAAALPILLWAGMLILSALPGGTTHHWGPYHWSTHGGSSTYKWSTHRP